LVATWPDEYTGNRSFLELGIHFSNWRWGGDWWGNFLRATPPVTAGSEAAGHPVREADRFRFAELDGDLAGTWRAGVIAKAAIRSTSARQ
jgi:hypothetical protein